MAPSWLSASILVSIVTIARAETAFTDNNDQQWAYTWYMGETFVLVCNSTVVNTQPEDRLIWETPRKQRLQPGYRDSNYEVRHRNGVLGAELVIKSVTEDVHGVYICMVRNNTNNDMRTRMILGLNLHGKKYRNVSEKYSSNLVVAFVSAIVFIIPVLSSYGLYHFKFAKKSTTHKFMYNVGEHAMKSTDNLADDEHEMDDKHTFDNPAYSSSA